MTNLTGTEKQIQWATKIRPEKLIEIERLRDMATSALANGKGNAPAIQKLLALFDWMLTNSAAAFWINIRQTDLDANWATYVANKPDTELERHKQLNFSFCQPCPELESKKPGYKFGRKIILNNGA